MALPFAVSSFQFVHGGQIPSALFIWKIPDEIDDRDETAEMRCQGSIRDELPRYCTREEWKVVKNKYGHLFGVGIPEEVLRVIYRELTGDASALRDEAIYIRALDYCISKGNPDLWPDLWAAINGADEKFSVFYKYTEQVIEEVSGATPYRHG